MPDVNSHDIRQLTQAVSKQTATLAALNKTLMRQNAILIDIAKAYMPMAMKAIEESEATEQNEE